MTTRRLIGAFVLAFLSISCMDDGSDGIEIFTMDFNFEAGAEGWTADFTEYPAPEDPLADTVYRWRAEFVPSAGITNGQNAYMMTCRNVSGDVFMFMKNKISGLRPSTTYNVVYEVQLTTDAVAGQGIILKGGASDLEPKKVIENGYYVLNIDKGADTTSGEDAISLGDIGTSYGESYNDVVKGNANSYQPFVAKSNSKGELWLIIGTDSLFEGITTVYFTDIRLVFSVSE